MLSCKDFLGWLNEHLDDPADSAVRAEVESHITSCPNCWVIFDTTKKTLQIYKAMEAEELPPQVQARLLETVNRKIAGGAPPPWNKED